MRSPPFHRYLFPRRSKFSPQYHVLKHPQLPFLPQCQRPSCLQYVAAQKFKFKIGKLHVVSEKRMWLVCVQSVTAGLTSPVPKKSVQYWVFRWQENMNRTLFLDVFFCTWRDSPPWARASSFTRFLVHTQRLSTLIRTPLDEWLATWQHTTLTADKQQYPLWDSNPQSQQASGPQTYALDRPATGIGFKNICCTSFQRWTSRQRLVCSHL